MKTRIIKIVIFSIITLGMIFYIGWVFYISEPKYIDNCYKEIEAYDLVSIPNDHSFYTNRDVYRGIILQRDSQVAIVKFNRYTFSDDLAELNIKQHNYRIIGKGTLYHKINEYVGLNIMVWTQVLMGVLSIIFTRLLLHLSKDFFSTKNI